MNADLVHTASFWRELDKPVRALPGNDPPTGSRRLRTFPVRPRDDHPRLSAFFHFHQRCIRHTGVSGRKPAFHEREIGLLNLAACKRL